MDRIYPEISWNICFKALVDRTHSPTSSVERSLFYCHFVPLEPENRSQYVKLTYAISIGTGLVLACRQRNRAAKRGFGRNDEVVPFHAWFMQLISETRTGQEHW